jgi:hypothetical protein
MCAAGDIRLPRINSYRKLCGRIVAASSGCVRDQGTPYFLVGGTGRCLGAGNLLLCERRCGCGSRLRLRHWTQPGGDRCSDSEKRDREHDNDGPSRRSTRRCWRPRHLRDRSGLKSCWWRYIRHAADAIADHQARYSAFGHRAARCCCSSRSLDGSTSVPRETVLTIGHHLQSSSIDAPVPLAASRAA